METYSSYIVVLFHFSISDVSPLTASMCSYTHYVFSLMDEAGTGSLTFQQFLSTLTTLSRGSREDRLAWAFRLYNLSGDGVLHRYKGRFFLAMFEKFHWNFFKTEFLKQKCHLLHSAV